LIAADLARCRLYGILDLSYVDSSEAEEVVGQMIDGGVDVIQLRAKAQAPAEIAEIATALHNITARRAIPLIVNDHPEIARDVGAEGVHVGQDDLAIAEVRRIVSPECVVGKSTHSVEQAMRAVEEGADYIGFGPIFATPTKPDYPAVGLEDIQKVHDAVRVPIFCIGGLKLENLPEVITAGARRVVIVSGLLLAADIASYARSAKQLLNPKSNPPQADENPKS
jgi:thiamine-phosphate pyrophosphorylase